MMQKNTGAQRAAADKLRAFTDTLRQAILGDADVTLFWKPAANAAALKAKREQWDSQDAVPEKSWASASAFTAQVYIRLVTAYTCACICCADITEDSALALRHRSFVATTVHRSAGCAISVTSALGRIVVNVCVLYCRLLPFRQQTSLQLTCHSLWTQHSACGLTFRQALQLWKSP